MIESGPGDKGRSIKGDRASSRETVRPQHRNKLLLNLRDPNLLSNTLKKYMRTRAKIVLLVSGNTSLEATILRSPPREVNSGLANVTENIFLNKLDNEGI